MGGLLLAAKNATTAASSTPSPWWTLAATVAGGVIVLGGNYIIEVIRRRTNCDTERRSLVRSEIARARDYHATVCALIEMHVRNVISYAVGARDLGQREGPDAPMPPDLERTWERADDSMVEVWMALSRGQFLASENYVDACRWLRDTATVPTRSDVEGDGTWRWLWEFVEARENWENALTIEITSEVSAVVGEPFDVTEFLKGVEADIAAEQASES